MQQAWRQREAEQRTIVPERDEPVSLHLVEAPADEGPASHDPDEQWRKIEGPLWRRQPGDRKDASPKDVMQGLMGNCYFFAALCAVAHARPESFWQIVWDNGDGTYTVRFGQAPTWFGETFGISETVVVDGVVPVWPDSGTPRYGSGRTEGGRMELWPLVLEKALAKVLGSYEATASGAPSRAMTWLTGRESDVFDAAALAPSEALGRIAAGLDAHMAITVSVHDAETLSAAERELADRHDVLCNHSYAVVGCDLGRGTVDLHNPWGFPHPRAVPWEVARRLVAQVGMN